MLRHLAVCCAFVSLLAFAPVAEAALKAERLTCEHLVNPAGVDIAAPRLSWIVTSDERGGVQTAYRIIAASSADKLAAGQGDLWDSGKVTSSETRDIVYAGKPLVSHQVVHWAVQVWDGDGKASKLSAPAGWTVGLLNPEKEWQAKWIGYDAERDGGATPAEFGGAKWIWFGGDPWPQAPKAHRLFVREFELPADIRIKSADLLVSADDEHRFTINGGLVSHHQGWDQPRAVGVLDRIQPGVNTLRAEVFNTSAGPGGLIAKLTITTQDDKVITIVTDDQWRAMDNPGANWHNRPMDLAEMPAAKAVGEYGAKPWGTLQLRRLQLPPVPHLRKTFEVTKPVRRAVVYATALGNVDVHLNGQRIADEYFTPGWTDYTKRIYYRAYDVTDRLKRGSNALGALLADGWYSGYIGWGHKRDHYGKQPRFAAQLHVTYEDGTSEVIITDESWQAATGAIREADFLMGEMYDARLELAGWDQPGKPSGEWKPVVTGAEMSPAISWHPSPPVVVFKEIEPVAITEPQPGVHVLDMGQNFAGVVRLKVKGKAGQAITLRFAERLNPDGTMYTTNLRGARTIDTYICRGEGVETWSPRFTFHGFQYVEITGIDGKPNRDTITGLALSSDTPVVGSFASSDPMLNQLHSNIYWTQRANFIEIPTDCPQRDERLGWTGDAQVYIRTAALNADVQAFFAKWLVDLEDAQLPDGDFVKVAPMKVAPDSGGPAWSDAGTICPWATYIVYGDRRVLEKHYDAVQRFIAFCEGRSKDGVLPPDNYHCFGDWLSIKADTPKDVIYTAYYAHSTQLAAEMAQVLGKADDAKRYRELFERIRKAFNDAYVKPDGRIHGDTQTCYTLALAYDLLDADKASAAANYLVKDIESRGWHLSTGFIGTKDLMLVLAKIGRNDVAYRLLHQDTFPSWGFSIRHGATSIWERWDGWTPENGFQNPGMNSFAHYSFGAVYQWMAENIGGFRPTSPGYATFDFAPKPGGKLTHAQVRYESPRGLIASAWKIDGGRLTLDVTIPANTTATVTLPVTSASKVTESGKPFDGSKPTQLGGGVYRFEITNPALVKMPE